MMALISTRIRMLLAPATLARIEPIHCRFDQPVAQTQQQRPRPQEPVAVRPDGQRDAADMADEGQPQHAPHAQRIHYLPAEKDGDGEAEEGNPRNCADLLFVQVEQTPQRVHDVRAHRECHGGGDERDAGGQKQPFPREASCRKNLRCHSVALPPMSSR